MVVPVTEEQGRANHGPIVEVGPQQRAFSSRNNLRLNVVSESRSVMRRYLLGVLLLFGLVATGVACMIIAKQHMEETTTTEEDKRTAYTSEFVVFLVLMAYCLIVPICWGVDWNCCCRRQTSTVAPICYPGDGEPTPTQLRNGCMEDGRAQQA
jgi:hypothetical protein